MADKTIGELPSIPSVQDNSLIPVEQNSTACKMTGAQFRQWAEASASSYATAAQQSATQAASSASEAAISATTAEQYASDAASSASNAATQATNAANSATQASNKATASAASADEAAAYARQAAAHTDLPAARGVQGTNSIVIGDVAHNNAVANYSVAEGKDTLATGEGAHAEGYGTSERQNEAAANGAHAEGIMTVVGVRARGGHAEGFQTNVSGPYSHAEGQLTGADGQAAHAEGRGTRANYDYQHVFGKYNDYSPSVSAYNLVEIVGNGTADDARSNARTLDWDGNETLAGRLTLGAAPISNMNAATKKYVDDGLSNKVSMDGKGDNFFENWYFMGDGAPGTFPIHQRYPTNQYDASTNGEVCIDRWRHYNRVHVTSQWGLVLLSNSGTIFQIFDAPLMDELNGEEVTVSVLTWDGNALYAGTIVYEKAPSAIIDVFSDGYFRCQLGTDGLFYFTNLQTIEGYNIGLKAIKLELGTQQTLARRVGNTWVLNDRIPNYQLELAKCQRYYEANIEWQSAVDTNGFYRNTIPYKVTKARAPTLYVSNAVYFNGTTWDDATGNVSVIALSNKPGYGCVLVVTGLPAGAIFDVQLAASAE